jgi:SRSO17 transposase
VAGQYSGTLGRTDNCQVAVSLHLAGEKGRGCIAMRLYLPEQWARSRKRRSAAGVPKGARFERKWQIALSQLDDKLEWGARRHVVLADAGYGNAREFRDGVRQRGLHYLLGVQGLHKAWPPGASPQQPPRVTGRRGGQASHALRGEGTEPCAIEALALGIPKAQWHTVSWHEGSRGEQSSRFAAVRVRTAERHVHGAPPSEEVWLLLEWPQGQKAPTKYYLSSLPADTPLKKLVRLAKLRWRVERDYQEMKGEVGLDHFEGRTWRGFHHHATLCMVAHGFLALRRALSPRRRTRWTLSVVRRRLQHLLLRRIGHCLLCLRHVGARAPPRGPSRI